MLEHVGLDLLDPQQERRLQKRPGFRDPTPGGGRIAGVQVNVKTPIIEIEMLNVKTLMRPLTQRLPGEAARALDVVFTQADDASDEGPGRRDHVAVAAIVRPLKDVVAADAELGQAPQVEERPEAEDAGGVELPDDARASFLEDRLGAVERFEPAAVAADQELGCPGR